MSASGEGRRAELRKEAEAELESRRDDRGHRADADPRELLHELQVHQIELELQNEELAAASSTSVAAAAAAEAASARAQALYEELYESSPFAYLSLDGKGDLLRLNSSAARLLGEEKEALVGRRLSSFLPPAEREAFAGLLSRCCGETARLEVSIQRSAMGSRRVLVDSIPGAGRDECRMALSDITDLRDAEEVQRAMEARMRSSLELNREAAERERSKLQLLFDRLPVGVTVLDSEGLIVKHNRRLEEILGLSPEDFDAKAYLKASFVDRNGQAIAEKDMPSSRVLAGEAACSVEMRMSRPWGPPVELLVNAVATPLPGWSAILITMDIGERKRAEQALREREEQLEFISDNIEDVLWRDDIQSGKYIYVSPSILKLRGFTQAEAMDQRLEERYNTETAALVRRLVQERMASFLEDETASPTYLDELQEPRKDGSLVWVETSTRYRRGSEGRLESIGVTRNIEARKRIEQQIADANSLNRSILGTSPIGILTYDDRGQCIAANLAAAAMLGASVEQLLAQNYHQLESWKSLGLVEAAERISASGGNLSRDLRLSSPFRKEFWASLRLTAFIANGKRHILIFMSDISDRRQAEAALRESEARYRLLFENAGIGIAIYAADGRVISFNKKAAANLGGSPADFEGRNLRDLFPREDAEKYIMRLGQALESSVPLEFEDSVDLQSGKKRFISVHAAIRVPDGSVLGVQVIAHDVTDRIESEHREREQRQQLIQAEKLASLGTLVAGVAHEINNPNHAIMLNTDLVSRVWNSLGPVLDRHFEGDEESLVGGIEYRELKTLLPGILQGTMASAAAIDDIVRGLKDFSSPDMSSHSDDIDLNLVIRGAVALISSLIKRSTKRFALDLAPVLPHVKGSFQRLEQVMINLLQNSCQALADPGQEIRVRSSWDEAAGEVLVEVLDSGRGMAAEELSRIKDPFFTTRRSEGGTGLGLSITNSIIEEHKGTLSFVSEPGAGTRVSIRIPAAIRPEHEERP